VFRLGLPAAPRVQASVSYIRRNNRSSHCLIRRGHKAEDNGYLVVRKFALSRSCFPPIPVMPSDWLASQQSGIPGHPAVLQQHALRLPLQAAKVLDRGCKVPNGLRIFFGTQGINRRRSATLCRLCGQNPQRGHENPSDSKTRQVLPD
jgi:hypothetical protein